MNLNILLVSNDFNLWLSICIFIYLFTFLHSLYKKIFWGLFFFSFFYHHISNSSNFRRRLVNYILIFKYFITYSAHCCIQLWGMHFTNIELGGFLRGGHHLICVYIHCLFISSFPLSMISRNTMKVFWEILLVFANFIIKKFQFSNPWKRQKIKGFQTFSGGVEMEHWAKLNWNILSSSGI